MTLYAVELFLAIRSNPYRRTRDYEEKFIWIMDMERALSRMKARHRKGMLMRACGLPVKHIAERLEVHVQTITNDLAGVLDDR